MAQYPELRPGQGPLTPLPEPFFTGWLPLADDLHELKLLLTCFWLLSRKQGDPRLLTRAELEASRPLQQALGADDAEGFRRALWAALERAVGHGGLLRLVGRLGTQEVDCYVLNTEKGRALVRQVGEGQEALNIAGLEGADWSAEPPTSSPCTSRTSACSPPCWPKNCGMPKPPTQPRGS
ncbi:MAG: hypothetical protein GX605_06195, partial [Chloroflexi bacterium]|nr:hypothetical protein [Chloroflexota bacterium]